MLVLNVGQNDRCAKFDNSVPLCQIVARLKALALR